MINKFNIRDWNNNIPLEDKESILNGCLEVLENLRIITRFEKHDLKLKVDKYINKSSLK